MIRRITTILSLLFLSSCSNLEKVTEKKIPIYDNYIAENKLEAIDKITPFRYHGWRSLDYEHLIISTALSRPYLIKLGAYCSELRFANTIAIHNTGSILQTKFDSIQVAKLDSTRAHLEKCYIKSIYEITREQADEISQLGHS